MRPLKGTITAMARISLVSAQPALLARFYVEGLGFHASDPKPIEPREGRMLGITGEVMRTVLMLGGQRVDLDRFALSGRPIRTDQASCDLDFQHFAIVTDDCMAAWERALGHGARPISSAGPVTLPETSGGVTAIKFRDPEGHPLELLQFPPGHRHHCPPAQGNRGIDHSAISVASLGAAQKFYEGLGLKVGDAGLNEGPEQATLDNLAEPVVDVVPMRTASSGPHLELLHYRQPRPNAPGVAMKVTDIAATRITWHADSDRLIHDDAGHIHVLMAPGS